MTPRDFYSRFAPPQISNDDTLGETGEIDVMYVGDARDMSKVPDGSVALVRHLPAPTLRGKEYETALGEGHVPADYIEYLNELLRDVLREERTPRSSPAVRLAVNVCQTSAASHIAALLPTSPRFCRTISAFCSEAKLSGRSKRGASGSCAWGSYQSPANPVLRDTTERVIIASKGRF